MVNNLNTIKNKIFHSIGWISIILIIIISFNYANYFELNNFKHTIVDGNNFYTDDFIISGLPYNSGCSIFDISPKTIQNKINELDYILYSNISILFPSTLIIQIYERKPLIYINNSMEEYIIDEDLLFLPINNNVKQFFKLPKVELFNEDIESLKFSYNNKLYIKDYLQIIELVKNIKYNNFEFYKKLNTISEFKTNFEFIINNHTKIFLSKTNYKQELINLFAFQKNIIEHKVIEDYEYINLQIPHQIVVKEKNI